MDSKFSSYLSLRIYDVLDIVGASENLRHLHRHSAMVQETMFSLEYDFKALGLTSYSFGSFCEGTTTFGLKSDIDRVEVDDRIPVCDRIGQTRRPGRTLLIIRDDETSYPGYAKLQVVESGLRMRCGFGELNFDTFDTDKSGNVYLRHVPQAINGYSERNGPADTYRFESGLSLDRVNALECAEIPLFACDFLTRYANCEWPSKNYVEAMDTLGCFFVGVGHPDTPDNSTEWRVSFSRQERLLMFSLNEVQHKCYILLKMIKKEFIENEVENSISSYHCKTCLFHVIQNTPSTLWIPENLCQCVMLCLFTLCQWLHHRYCPNFFIGRENMFERKVFKVKRNILLQTVKGVIEKGYTTFFQLKSDHIGDFLVDSQPDLEKSARLLTSHHGCMLLVRAIEDILHTDPRKYRVNSLGVRSGEDHPALIDFKILERVERTKRLRWHTRLDTTRALSYLKPLLHLNLAQSLVSLWFKAESRQASIVLIKAFDYHFQRAARGYSVVSWKLVRATILYRLGKYKECNTLLQEVKSDFKSYVASVCSCQEKINRSNVYVWNEINGDLTFNSFFRNAIAPCIQFVPTDAEIIPTALKYEMFRSTGAPKGTRKKDADYWYDFAVVDARVYMSFMEYLVSCKLDIPVLKVSAIRELNATLCSDESLGHRETGCNLIGWIFIQEGQIHDAMEAFVLSWKLKPHHNAAKWHIRQLMARILQGSAKQQ